MRAQWMGALVGAVVFVVLAVIAAAIYHYEGPTATGQAIAASNAAPTSIQDMTLEAQFKGPLKDTVIQRWGDPSTGATCYIYLPVVVEHSKPTPTGYVQYGGNGIGSISCFAKS